MTSKPTVVDHSLLRETSELPRDEKASRSGCEENNILTGPVQIPVDVVLVIHRHCAVDSFQNIPYAVTTREGKLDLDQLERNGETKKFKRK